MNIARSLIMGGTLATILMALGHTTYDDIRPAAYIAGGMVVAYLIGILAGAELQREVLERNVDV